MASKAPGGDAATATPTPAPGGSTSTATPALSPVQSLKISVKDGETVLDINAEKIAVKDASGNAVTATKASDNTFTTEKLVAGTYTVSVAAMTIGDVAYNGIDVAKDKHDCFTPSYKPNISVPSFNRM